MNKTSDIEQEIGEQMVRDMMENILVSPNKHKLEDWKIKIGSFDPNWFEDTMVYLSAYVTIPDDFTLSTHGGNGVEINWVQNINWGYIVVDVEDKSVHMCLDFKPAKKDT